MHESNAAETSQMKPSPFPWGREYDSVAVLGLGNILLTDEGAGVHSTRVLSERYIFSPSIDIIDGGTMGLDLLPLFQDRDRILIMDAVDFGMKPGYVGIVENDAISSVLNTKLSVHHIGLADLLFATKLTRETTLEVCLIGIQPQSLDVGLAMTDRIKSKVDRMLELTVQKLAAWNIKCSLRSRSVD